MRTHAPAARGTEAVILNQQLLARDWLLGQNWSGLADLRHTQPTGEARHKALAARRELAQAPAEPQVVDTLGGRMHVRWDEAAAATPHGQLVFFAEFLATTGVFDRWVSSCPLAYRSGNAPDKRDVLGTGAACKAGWLHHARHQALPERGALQCARLQRVELVLSCRAPRWPHGSHHQPSAAACGCG